MIQHELMYFSDPMCSWCYGFGPVIEKLQQSYAAQMPLQLILGGLRPDEDRPLPEKMSAEIAHHWEAVHESTGREFDFSFFEKHPNFVYNTAPACRAVVAAGRGDAPRPMQFQHALQRRFYGKAEDPTSLDTFASVAEEIGQDPAHFRETYADPETESITRNNFAMARAFGINGYPTLVLHERDGEDEKHILVARGYMPFESMHERLELILKREVDLVAEE